MNTREFLRSIIDYCAAQPPERRYDPSEPDKCVLGLYALEILGRKEGSWSTADDMPMSRSYWLRCQYPDVEWDMSVSIPVGWWPALVGEDTSDQTFGSVTQRLQELLDATQAS